MACFWIAIEQATRPLVPETPKRKPEEMAILVQARNQKTPVVQVNGVSLTEQAQTENLKHCEDYNIETVYNGYDCSTSDPFLCLIAHLFNVDIHHTYMSTEIKYTVPTPSCIIRFRSNRGHFWH